MAKHAINIVDSHCYETGYWVNCTIKKLHLTVAFMAYDYAQVQHWSLQQVAAVNMYTFLRFHFSSIFGTLKYLRTTLMLRSPPIPIIIKQQWRLFIR